MLGQRAAAIDTARVGTDSTALASTFPNPFVARRREGATCVCSDGVVSSVLLSVLLSVGQWGSVCFTCRNKRHVKSRRDGSRCGCSFTSHKGLAPWWRSVLQDIPLDAASVSTIGRRGSERSGVRHKSRRLRRCWVNTVLRHQKRLT